MRNNLRDPTEFQCVYRKGKRYDGRFFSVFVLDNSQLHHRVGVTASKKAIGNAVQRNRAKRLLREAFRINNRILSSLANKYDWVLNARSPLLRVKLDAPAEELAAIIATVRKSEQPADGSRSGH